MAEASRNPWFNAKAKPLAREDAEELDGTMREARAHRVCVEMASVLTAGIPISKESHDKDTCDQIATLAALVAAWIFERTKTDKDGYPSHPILMKSVGVFERQLKGYVEQLLKKHGHERQYED